MGLDRIRTNDDGEHVQFRPDAAASFRRMEAQQGRQLDVNRTVVDRAIQADLYAKRLRGEYPYPVAHPDKSDHVYRSDTDGGNAWDTDERGDWLEENGWIADVAGEPWHRRYILARDRRRNDPAPAATNPEQSEEDDMKVIYSEHLDREFLIGDSGVTHLHGGSSAALNAVGIPGNRHINKLGKDDFRKVIEAYGLSYEQTRLLGEGQRLLVTGQVVDAGNVPWGDTWA